MCFSFGNIWYIINFYNKIHGFTWRKCYPFFSLINFSLILVVEVSEIINNISEKSFEFFFFKPTFIIIFEYDFPSKIDWIFQMLPKQHTYSLIFTANIIFYFLKIFLLPTLGVFWECGLIFLLILFYFFFFGYWYKYPNPDVAHAIIKN